MTNEFFLINVLLGLLYFMLCSLVLSVTHVPHAPVPLVRHIFLKYEHLYLSDMRSIYSHFMLFDCYLTARKSWKNNT